MGSLVTLLPANISRYATTLARVSSGLITSSTNPLAAAESGDASVFLYSSINFLRSSVGLLEPFNRSLHSKIAAVDGESGETAALVHAIVISEFAPRPATAMYTGP